MSDENRTIGPGPGAGPSQPPPEAGAEAASSARLLGILGRALTDASGVIDQGSRDLGERFGPIWGEIVGGFGAVAIQRKLDEIAGILQRFEGEARVNSAALKRGVKRLVDEASKPPAAQGDDLYQMARSEELESKLGRAVEQAIQRQFEGLRAATPPKSQVDRGREPASPNPPHPKEDQAAALAKLREELEAARGRAAEAETASRKHQNEKVNYQADLKQALDDLTRWRLLTLGEDLVADPTCAAALDDLVRDALGGLAASVSLIGQWMTFRTVSPDRLPILMRQIGEAYYTWRPRTNSGPVDDDPLESALVRGMQARCDRLGVRNKVEVIRPNARFDTGRHETEGGGGGIAVVEVRGWLVLKADGAVIYRAKVVSR